MEWRDKVFDYQLKNKKICFPLAASVGAGRAHAHLAAAFSARLVAVRVEALVCLTATGAAGLVTPPASGTRQIGSAHTSTALFLLQSNKTTRHTKTYRVLHKR